MKRVLFAAGGTMGHIGPALAIASSLQEREPQATITFVGTKSGLETSIVLGFPLKTILRVPLPREVNLQLLLFPIRFTIALVQSLLIVKRNEVVVGFGGYVCTPIYLAARILRRRLIVHEANALPGFANRVGKSLGAETFTNFANVARLWNGRVVGIPLRNEIIDLAHGDEKIKRDGARRNVLVMGGSQGSAKINQAIWEAFHSLPKSTRIVHAVGIKNLASVPSNLDSERYRAVGYFEDVAQQYREADLVIARAGAVTCAEIRALSKRAILVPLGHGNGEQAENARELVGEGLAIAVPDDEFSGTWLVENIERGFLLEPRKDIDPRLGATEIMVDAILSGWSTQ